MSINNLGSHINFLREMYTQDSVAIQRLKALLLEERDLLERRQHEGLHTIIAHKDNLLETLTFNAKQREQLLVAAGLDTTLAGWEQLLLREPSTRPLIAGWQALTNEFIECQKANEINGRMINRSKQTLTHLLNLIRGQVAVPSLYTQTGTTANHNSPHTIVKA